MGGKRFLVELLENREQKRQKAGLLLTSLILHPHPHYHYNPEETSSRSLPGVAQKTLKNWDCRDTHLATG